jgi:LuxR family maltose regulon positive regulatory protein
VAWLSLDEGDNDPTRFLTYLVAALQTIGPTIGAEVLGLLHSSQPPPVESILTTLLNDLTTVLDNPSTGPAQGFVLVLDDYHVIEAQAIDQALTFLLEHLPPHQHLVITTREDPQQPLARYRARGHSLEMRATDLRFTPGEAATFLNQVMGLGLSAEEVTSLEARTEGWIAGLQLAALSMQGRDASRVAGFIRAFAGDNRYIVDYLVEEVLQRQPERTRSFLLQTSILDRLSGPLCDALVRGLEIRRSTWKLKSDEHAVDNLQLLREITDVQSQETLEYLERANLFVVPLDDKRHWFRYHHLFADVLHAHLMQEQPNLVPILHRRASAWYEHNGSPAEAIHHALAAEDFERAAGLIEMAWPAMDGRFQTATWLGWVKMLPDELVRARPVLSVGVAWAFLNEGELEAGEAWLRDAERWLNTTADMLERPLAETSPERSRRMVVVDKEQFRSLPASIAKARAYIAQALGDSPGTVKYAQQALDLLPEDDHIGRGPAAALLGLAQLANGELEAAHRDLAEALANFQSAGNLLFAISGVFVLADIRITQGRLHEAIRTYEQSLRLATEQGGPVLRGTADMVLGLGELHYEQGDLEAATQHLLRSKELGEQAAQAQYPYRWCLAQARIKEAQGDLEGALDLLDEAERRYIRSPIPDVRPLAALKARVWVRQGRLTEALAWAREQGLSVDDDLSFMREFEHITLTRVLIAAYKHDRADDSIFEAVGLLGRLRQAAEEGGRMGSVIEILVLQALAHEAQGSISAALAPLERSLTLAEPEGYVRIFVDEGLPIAHLLREVAARGMMPDYIGKLLAAFEDATEEERRKTKENIPSPIARPSSPVLSEAEGLIEPLSDRELEVLHLIAQGLSNREISERLFLALSTVKGHNRNIFGKLQVQRRTEAVARARELGLV